MKTAICTAIFGKRPSGWDYLLEPQEITPDTDYFCFTDRRDFQSDVWKIIRVEEEDPNEAVYRAKNYKILIHKHFPGYEKTVWVDGNILIKKDLTPLLQHSFALHRHRFIKDYIHEAKTCIKLKLDDEETINNQVEIYKKEGFSHKIPHCECGVIVRENNEKINDFNEFWWRQVNRHSIRDQISFPYCIWKKRLEISFLPGNFNNSEYFQLFERKKSNFDLIKDYI